ncbi:hypothetical protein COX84_05665, partial [Candidatus Micrarchaeota archaeon CG_4_10_14_0_2_um_filter_49_7]
MGSTGAVTGKHLHFILNTDAGTFTGGTLNPELYLVENVCGCGVVCPGEGSGHSDIFKAAYDNAGGQSVLGCSQNGAHWAGGIVNGTDYNLVLQDFLKDGVWNVIIHDEPNLTQQAYVLLDDFRETYFNIENWWMTLGAPLNNEDDAATSPQGTTGRWQQFESGQIYSSHFGTFATYGKVYNFYYHYNEGGTHSNLGFPTGPMLPLTNATTQTFEGGAAVYCPNQGACTKVIGTFCIPPTPTPPQGSLYRKVHGLAAMLFEPCDTDTTTPTQGTAQLSATAVNAFVPKVEVNDTGGIRWVHMHIRPQGGDFEAIPMTLSNGMWEVNYNTNAYANGQVLEYLFWASDMTGNAVQISGLNSVTVQNDHTAPTLISINVPTSADASFPMSVS